MSRDDETSHNQMPRYASLAARVLARARRLEPDIAPPAVRERAIAALASALTTRPARAVRRRVVIGLGAAAVAVVVVGLVQLDRDRQVTVSLDRGPPLAVGAVVRADPERSVSLSLSTGTRLRLSDAGRMSLAAIGPRQHFVLEAGRLWANVAPLASRDRFLIATPDAEIEVRGTAFEIVVAPEHPQCGGGITQVKVSEGLVTVRRGDRLWQVAAGRSWPDPCPPERPSLIGDSAIGDSAKTADAAATTSVPPRRMRPLPPRDRPAISRTASDLRQQNDLFAAAMAARRRGDVVSARRALDDLVTRFPFGALAGSARDVLAELRRPPSAAAGSPP